jgi:ABC-type uncharacterized transport system fused permease/ATPase subunit
MGGGEEEDIRCVIRTAVYIHSWLTRAFASLICFVHLLRRSSLTAADLGVFCDVSPVMLWVWCEYALGMVWVWCGYRTKFRRWGADPPPYTSVRLNLLLNRFTKSK